MRAPAMFIYGFAVFAMFFGSGNLVFPLQIGFFAGSHWFVGFLGLLLTGVLLPFLGLFVIKLYHGSYQDFFTEAGGLAKLLLPLFTLSLLGSFGVVPRCITVAHGGLEHLFPDLSLLVFSLIFCATTFLLCLKDQLMVSVVGKWMSPVLLLSLLGLIVVGVVKAPAIATDIALPEVFLHGFITGYQTMDLFAAFFFSALIFSQIKEASPQNLGKRGLIRLAVIPSIIGSSMLALVYLGLVFLGAHYQELLGSTDPEQMLPAIATHVLGTGATGIIAIAMIFSCLTTAVVLNNIYARYLLSALGLPKRRFFAVLLATTLVAFLISLLDFRGIAAFLVPALQVSYPGLILLTVLSIAGRGAHKLKMYTFWGATIVMVIYTIFRDI